MKLSEHLLGNADYNDRQREIADERFELFEYLHKKHYTVQQAVDLLFVTKNEIHEEYKRSIERAYL